MKTNEEHTIKAIREKIPDLVKWMNNPIGTSYVVPVDYNGRYFHIVVK